jgi:UDP-glucose 4-epimerase
MMQTPLSKKRIVVTGGAGFLGSHVAKLLIETDNHVVVFDDFSNGKSLHLQPLADHPKLEVIRGDVTNIEDVRKAFAGCDIVIHLAVLCLRQSIKDPHRVNDVIVKGTLNCLEVARRNQVECFLNCSSSEVYGTANSIPMNEEHPLHPETPYASAKVAQDMYVYSYGRTYGLPWTTIRPFNMYGPNSHWQGHRGELIPKMIVRAMNQAPLILFGDGSQTRDFTYVRDAAKAVVAVAAEPASRNTSINFCSASETSIRQIAELICSFFDLDPKRFIHQQPPRPGDVQRHFGDNSKFKKMVGFAPETSLSEGLRHTIAWFQSLPLSPAELIRQEAVRNWE